MNTKHYDLFYTVIKNRDAKEIVNDEYENDYFNFIDLLPNQYFGVKPRETILKKKKMRSHLNHFKFFLLYQ